MKILRNLIAALVVLFQLNGASAQNARFFRISGPGASTIVAFQSDGTLIWSNTLPGGTYSIQTVSSFPSDTNWADYVQLPVTNAINTNHLVDFNPPSGMAFIPAGVFTMGDTLDGNVRDDAGPTNITVSAFYMDAHLVRYDLWQTVYNWATNNGYMFFSPGMGRSADNPVTDIDWYDCVKWCNARSQLEGLPLVYFIDAGFTQPFTNGEVTVYADWSARGYRLPTEAEWEKAARGGLIGKRFPWGDTVSRSQANYQSDPDLGSYDLGPSGYNPNFVTFYPDTTPWTSPVGYFAPNGYGLYDMAGNLTEFCWDWYGVPYGLPTTFDPTGPVSGTYHVMRGGDFASSALPLRCATRSYYSWATVADIFGFRCARRY